MKNLSLSAGLAGMFVAAMVTAQTLPAQPTPAPSAQPAPSSSSMTSPPGMMHDGMALKDWERNRRASKIIGMDVRNNTNEKVGDIKEIVLDGNGRVAYAVVSAGGFLGIGDRLYAVPWSAFKRLAGQNYFVWNIAKERLRDAPGFDEKHWPDMANEQWNRDTQRFYNQPAGGTSTKGPMTK